MTARLTADQVRAKLRTLGVQRRALRLQHERLLEDTIEGLALARGVVPFTEAATLCGVSRSTAYLLGGRGDGDDRAGARAAPGGAAACEPGPVGSG